MDFKGITWIENVYQKFEAMCLELEETMYQDTIKYVDNQVQTIGANVKRFYSDVKQDLVPSSTTDSVKMVTDFPLHKHIDASRSRICTTGEVTKTDIEQLTGHANSIANGDKSLDHASLDKELWCETRSLSSSSEDSVNGDYFYFSAAKKNSGGFHKEPNMGMEEITKANYPPPAEVSGIMTLDTRKLSGPSPCCDLSDDTHKTENNLLAMTSNGASNNVTSHDLEEEATERECHDDSMDTVEFMTDVSAVHSPSDVRDSNASDEMEEADLERSSSVDRLHTQLNGLPCTWNPDEVEGIDVMKQNMEPLKLLTKDKLHESCVVVEGDEFCYACHKDGTRKSYKSIFFHKKIRNAISLKMLSRRTNEYKKLATGHGEMHVSEDKDLIPTVPLEPPSVKLERYDLCESEWELL